MVENHFFEGPEKKLEIVFKPESLNLLDKPREVWGELVACAHAKILSVLESPDCKAFLLSESSLFVWQSRLTLITCGTTTLIKAADFLIEKFGKESIEEIFYERKNEYQPTLQKSTAFEDMKKLKRQLGGEVFRYGRQDDHHVFIYNNQMAPSTTDSKIKTLELLMYGLRGEFKDSCVNQEEHKEKIRRNLKEILPGFNFDMFFFDPEGFSFNALNGSQYATMHVTPQGSENYLSFEMDSVGFREAHKVIENLLKLCKPSSFDLILFSEEKENFMAPDHYTLKQKSFSETPSGYHVVYSHYYDQDSVEEAPFEIN